MKSLLACILFFVTATCFAQFDGLKITVFRKGYESKTEMHKFFVSEPFGAKEAIVLDDKGGIEPNVWFTMSWPKALTADTPARVLVLDEKGLMRDDLNPKFFKKGAKELTYFFRIPKGSYKLQLVHSEKQEKVYGSVPFTVIDKIGVRATGNQKAGLAKLWICDKVDDDWKPVGAIGDVDKGTFSWPANKSFNVLVKNNSKLFGVSFLGIVIHKQGNDGKDASFITEFQTEMLDEKKATMWCTVEGLPNMTGLDAGVYSIYVISWDKRQPLEHTGNLTEYFAKITLTVK